MWLPYFSKLVNLTLLDYRFVSDGFYQMGFITVYFGQASYHMKVRHLWFHLRRKLKQNKGKLFTRILLCPEKSCGLFNCIWFLDYQNNLTVTRGEVGGDNGGWGERWGRKCKQLYLNNTILKNNKINKVFRLPFSRE